MFKHPTLTKPSLMLFLSHHQRSCALWCFFNFIQTCILIQSWYFSYYTVMIRLRACPIALAIDRAYWGQGPGLTVSVPPGTSPSQRGGSHPIQKVGKSAWKVKHEQLKLPYEIQSILPNCGICGFAFTTLFGSMFLYDGLESLMAQLTLPQGQTPTEWNGR